VGACDMIVVCNVPAISRKKMYCILQHVQCSSRNELNEAQSMFACDDNYVYQ
jgi:hypothetical protein